MNMRHPAMLLLGLLILAAPGCGAGGSSETAYVCYETQLFWRTAGGGPVAGDLSGSYILSGLQDDFYTVARNRIRTITQDDWQSLNGTLDIGGGIVNLNYSVTGQLFLLTMETANKTFTWYLAGENISYKDFYDSISWAGSTDGLIQYADGYVEEFSVSADRLKVVTWGCVPLAEDVLTAPQPLGLAPSEGVISRGRLSPRDGL